VTSSPPVNGVYDGGSRYEALDRVTPVLAEGHDDLFADLGRAAGRVVLLRDVPKSSYDPGTCLTPAHRAWPTAPSSPSSARAGSATWR
ncbi:hypothetical protein, partial [Nocardioides abyssi]